MRYARTMLMQPVIADFFRQASEHATRGDMHVMMHVSCGVIL